MRKLPNVGRFRSTPRRRCGRTPRASVRRSPARRSLGSRGVRTRLTLGERWRRGQRGWPAGFPLVQFPNAPLIAALGGWLVAALAHGSVHASARARFLRRPGGVGVGGAGGRRELGAP